VVRAGFSRLEVLGELRDLAAKAKEKGTILVGMDFCFAFPHAEKGGCYPDGSRRRADFWRAVHEQVWPSSAVAYVERFAEHFLWYDQVERRKRTGKRYLPARRATEVTADEAGARANTVFKLVGSNQVGKGSLCGIALLEALRRHCLLRGLSLVVWPLLYLDASGVERPLPPPWLLADVPDRCLVVVETYPSLHWASAGFRRNRPWDQPGAWPVVRRRFSGSASRVAPASGDEGDALIGWYALSEPGARYSKAPSASAELLLEEGWIFGV
jgi:hypothetical protein